MPKTEKVSLGKIGEQIDKAVKELSNARKKTREAELKEHLNAKIKDLKKIKKEVQEICPKGKNSYVIIIPTWT